MLASVIKFLFIYLSCIHIYFKSTPSLKLSTFTTLIISSIMAVTTYLINLYSSDLSYVVPLILFWIITSILNNSPQQSFISLVISFTISLSLCGIFSFIIILAVTPFIQPTEHFLPIAFTTGIIQFITVHRFLKRKRYKNKISFLFSSPVINFLTLVCLSIIALAVYLIRTNAISHLHFAWIISFVPYAQYNLVRGMDYLGK